VIADLREHLGRGVDDLAAALGARLGGAILVGVSARH
jgi:hypothetical protein